MFGLVSILISPILFSIFYLASSTSTGYGVLRSYCSVLSILDFEETVDVLQLMLVIAYLEEQLSDSFKQTFERQMAQLESPDVVISELMMEIFTEMDEQVPLLSI